MRPRDSKLSLEKPNKNAQAGAFSQGASRTLPMLPGRSLCSQSAHRPISSPRKGEIRTPSLYCEIIHRFNLISAIAPKLYLKYKELETSMPETGTVVSVGTEIASAFPFARSLSTLFAKEAKYL